MLGALDLSGCASVTRRPRPLPPPTRSATIAPPAELSLAAAHRVSCDNALTQQKETLLVDPASTLELAPGRCAAAVAMRFDPATRQNVPVHLVVRLGQGSRELVLQVDGQTPVGEPIDDVIDVADLWMRKARATVELSAGADAGSSALRLQRGRVTILRAPHAPREALELDFDLLFVGGRIFRGRATFAHPDASDLAPGPGRASER
jgi:hypothetical protein